MVVCKFFQQGSCRFGQNCRFEHVYGSKYSYYAPQAQATQAPAVQGVVTDEQLIHQVQTDVQAVLRGGQWILTSYAPFKEKPCLPGISDLSPEEARLFIYEAKANNCVDMAVNYMNTITQETRSKYEQLLQPTPQIVKVLRRLYYGEISQSPFNTNQNTFGSSNAAATSIFRSAAQNTSVFNQNANQPSVFGQNNAFASPDAAKSIFSQASSAFNSPPSNMSSNVFGPSQDAAKSIFGQANQSVPNQNMFNLQMQQQQSVFSSPPSQANPASIFATASQQIAPPSDPFNQQSSPFQISNVPTNVFQQSVAPTNVFGAANVFAQQMDDGTIYSKEEELSAEDLEAFKSNQFKLGFVPDLPPPKSLCSM